MMVTDHIDTFTPEGIRLRSGEELKADIIVTATGLKAEIFSGMQLSVDDTVINPADTFTYKGMMLSGLPNFAFSEFSPNPLDVALVSLSKRVLLTFSILFLFICDSPLS